MDRPLIHLSRQNFIKTLISDLFYAEFTCFAKILREFYGFFEQLDKSECADLWKDKACLCLIFAETFVNSLFI